MSSGPCRGRYLIQNPLANKVIGSVDLGLSLLRPLLVKKRMRPISSLLICNTAQLGDVVMSTGLLPALRKHYPHLKIGMLVGSWAKPLVEGLVDNVHSLDHWKVSRKEASLLQKYQDYRRSFRKTLKELREVAYDAAFDLSYYFPSSAFLLNRAKIPYTTGYASAGLSPLFTDPKEWHYEKKSALHYFADLFNDQLPIAYGDLKTQLITKETPRQDYIVVHMGSGHGAKDWPLEQWSALLKQLSSYRIILTGHGPKEDQAIRSLCKQMPTLVNAANRLSLSEFVQTIKEARLLISVDTAAGHIAAATETPSVHIYCGINPIEQWTPYGSVNHVLIHEMPCYPCFRKNGCEGMNCIRSVTPERVLKAVRSLLQT